MCTLENIMVFSLYDEFFEVNQNRKSQMLLHNIIISYLFTPKLSNMQIWKLVYHTIGYDRFKQK